MLGHLTIALLRSFLLSGTAATHGVRRGRLPGMMHSLLVALGGAAGALARWKLSGIILHRTVDWRFPAATFAVNVIGCLVAGVLVGLVTRREWFSADARLFLFTGLLGGFTTFSAFGVETVYLLRRGEHAVALAYVLLSVVCSVAGLALGMAIIPGRGAVP